MVSQTRAALLAIGMGECRRATGREQPIDRTPSRAAAIRIELSEQVEQADPLAHIVTETGQPRQSRTQFNRGRTRLPAPRSRALSFPSAAARPAAAQALGMTMGELNGVEKLLFAERTDEEVRRTSGE
jgi:hypothetical protein